MSLRPLGFLAASAALLLLTACGGDGDYGSFWKALPKVEEGASPAPRQASARGLEACPASKCLTVYVAPWCHYCREATPSLLALREFLKERGVVTRFIVGLDQPEAMRAYAREFGPEAVTDDGGELGQGGVPHFYVTDREGRLLKDQAGVPQGVEDPGQFAALLGLP